MLKKYSYLLDDAPVDGGGGKKVTAPQIVKVHEPNKPVPEATKAMTFSVDEYEPEQLPVQGTQEPVIEPEKKVEEKKIETKKEIPPVEEKKETPLTEEKKVEDKKEEKLPSFLKPPGAKKGEEKTEKPKEERKFGPSDKATRDYSGFSADEVILLKQMSNDGFAFTSKLIKENRELGKLKNSLYLQHDNAFMLDPAFQSLRVDQHYAKMEGDLWKEQLLLMQAGKPWKPLTGFDKDGRPVYDKEREPNAADEEEVRRVMSQAYRQSDDLAGKINGYPSQYQTQIKSDLQAIEQERARRFSWVSNPELLDYSMHIEGVGDQTIKEIRDNFIGLFPPYLANSPGVQVAADLFVALRYSNAELEEARAGSKIADIKKEEASRGEPSSDKRQLQKTGKPVHGVTEFVDDSATV